MGFLVVLAPCTYCEKREQEEQGKQIKCNKVSIQKSSAMSKGWAVVNDRPRDITQKGTGHVIECAHNFSEESQSSSGLSSNQRGPLDRGASIPMSKNVKDWNSVATNSIPFELRPECNSNVYLRGVHFTEGDSEISWGNDQEFVKWKKAQVQDPILSTLYNWVDRNERGENWEELTFFSLRKKWQIKNMLN